MNYYKTLETILLAKSPLKKIELFNDFYEKYKEGEVGFEENYSALELSKPSYYNFCNSISPQDVPKRKNLTSVNGQINLIHAVAHIEYSAIDLALDSAYRFSGLPKEYYDDWLEVADDEIRHFLMLEKLLKELGSSYGEVNVHDSLFEAGQKTINIVERMAVVPRYLEANGLDATPMILKKLKKLQKSESLEKIIQTLSIILDEEVEHVRKGDVWFSYVCEKEGLNTDIFFDIIKKYYPRSFLRPNDLNIEARKMAGFSCQELKIMAKKDVC
ncbi:ferritin-like domain-containing protein [Sulfurimonas sp. SAG-AH-194-C20]|nr:ferritin-like domain-containing protein [Sulfurimonas sp. SAG-AH-194-C20]MDF1879258.1 ferritin-like domain-containing protein [Sulfurimonas sp. SAG-AH-194-C20]